MQDQPLIRVEGLGYKIGSQSILEQVSFEIKKGEYVGVLGPNGGGKSTLLKLILGLLKPSAGEIFLYGTKAAKFKQRYKLGYVPQHLGLSSPGLPATVLEVIQSGLTAKLGPFRSLGSADHQAVEQAIELCALENLKKQPLAGLSGGERQRVFIARALAAGPELLLLDEPVTGVDLASQERFYQFIAKLNRELQLTLMFVSHDLGVIVGEVSSLLCLNKTLVCHGPAADSYNDGLLNQLYGKSTHSHLHHHH